MISKHVLHYKLDQPIILIGYSELKDEKNKTEHFLLIYGIIYVFKNSQKDKGKALKERVLKYIVPLEFNARIAEVQEKHQRAIEGKQRAIADHDNQT